MTGVVAGVSADASAEVSAEVSAETRAWVDRAVIGLNLCPFAKAVQAKGRIRYVVCEASDEPQLLVALLEELERLAHCDAEVTDTTLLIHPKILTDFDRYNQFLMDADALLASAGFEGMIQLASFHPDYRFAGSAADAIDNATNRSPYPMLHLLRESSVARAVAAIADPQQIVDANIRTLRVLGKKRLRALMRACHADAAAAIAAGTADAADAA